MKRFFLYAAAVAAIMVLTSCLEGGNNSHTGTTVGVVRFDSKTMKNVLDNPVGYGPFYSPSFSTVNEGACIIAAYELNLDAAENASSVVKKNGYYTVNITNKAELDKYTIMRFSDTGAPDTAKVMEKEVPLLNPNYQRPVYVSGCLFASHTLKQPTDQKNYWFLSYDAEHQVKEENGVRIYDVFLRAKVKTAGTKSEQNVMVINAYYIKDYIEKAAREEKAKGNSAFYLRFNYASSVKDSVLTWSKAEKMKIPVAIVLDGMNNTGK